MAGIQEICAQLPARSYLAGHTLIEEGSTNHALLVLSSGTVEILKAGMQINVVSDAGAFFGELSLLLNIPAIATVRAVTPVEVRVIDDGQAFLADHPELALAIARLVAQRLHQVTTYLADIKRQFEDQDDHLGVVDEVLESLLHNQPEQSIEPGSDREREPNI